jgi:DNA-binding MltR family transcriptional regulator
MRRLTDFFDFRPRSAQETNIALCVTRYVPPLRVMILSMSDNSPPKVNPVVPPNVRHGKSLDEKLNKEELEAFYDQSSARAYGIVLSAILENHLTAILRLLMRREPKIADELFRPTGPLGPFGTKIRLAYLMRVIHKDIYTDLTIVTKIRNAFAHDLSITSFDQQMVRDLIKNMHCYSVLVSIAEKSKQEAETNTRRTFAYVIGESLREMRTTYRECCRILMHHLIDFENHIHAEEARINSPVAGKNSTQEQPT